MKRSALFPALFIFVTGLILNFAFTGHAFIAYSLYLVSALIVFFSLAPKNLRRIVCVLLSLCLIYFIIIEIPIVKHSNDHCDDAKYIIVLGAAVHGKTPSLSLIERLRAAREYLTAHPDSVAIVSGGQGDGEAISEAQAMYDWLSESGIDKKRIIKEDKATSTYENIKFSLDIINSLGDDPSASTAIVTSEYHVYRALLIGKTLGVDLKAVAAETSILTVRLNYFIREAFGVTYQLIFG